MITSAIALDALMRHQVYLDGYKNYVAWEAEQFTAEMLALLLVLIYKTGKETLSELTKKEINQVISEFNKRAMKQIKAFNRRFMSEAAKFVRIDFDILARVYSLISPKKGTKPKQAAGLWARIQNAFTPATGLEPKAMIMELFGGIVADAKRLLKMAYASNETVKELTKGLLGTKEKEFRDGYINKAKNKVKATTNTFLQYISNYLSHLIGGQFFDEYEWVSVLDSRTTDICRSRDGMRFRYGSGPVPPAHYNCRSIIVPVVNKAQTTDGSFYDWLMAQPKTILADVLGVSKARRKDLTPDDIPTAKDFPKLTLSQFNGKRDNITK